MRLRVWLLAAAVPVALSAASSPAEKPKPLVVWPGYTLEFPPDYCVEQRNGPDFHELHVRNRKADEQLVGIYCGHHPSFEPDCVKPAKKTRRLSGQRSGTSRQRR